MNEMRQQSSTRNGTIHVICPAASLQAESIVVYNQRCFSVPQVPNGAKPVPGDLYTTTGMSLVLRNLSEEIIHAAAKDGSVNDRLRHS